MLHFEVTKKRVSFVSIDIYLGKHVELNIESVNNVFLDFFIRPWLLYNNTNSKLDHNLKTRVIELWFQEAHSSLESRDLALVVALPLNMGVTSSEQE